MPWWTVLGLLVLGGLSWAYVKARVTLEKQARQGGRKRRRKVSELAQGAVEGDVRMLSNRPVEEDPLAPIHPRPLKIDRGE